MSAREREAERVYEQELLLGGVTDVLNAIVSQLGISQRELAERLGVTEGRVSQILSGTSGLTLGTLASFGWATGLRFDLVPKAAEGELSLEGTSIPWLEGLWSIVADVSEAEGGASSSQRSQPPRPARALTRARPRLARRKGVQAMARNERHVVPSSEGGWDIKAPKADRSSGHFDRQSEAIDRAREIVRNSGGGEIVIHDRDGRVRDSDTVPPGHDPFPPRDKK